MDRTYIAMTPALARPNWAGCLHVDLYDDWSIAPGINPAARMMAAGVYHQLAQLSGLGPVVSVNTPYMRYRVGGDAIVIPNGTSEKYGGLARMTEGPPCLVVMGSLHRRRVDWHVIEAVVRSLHKDAVAIFCGSGTLRAAKRAAAVHGRVQHYDYLSFEELCVSVGPGSVALLPLPVNDYTLSQDPMKLYAFLALGFGVVMPRALWPGHMLPDEYAVLYEFPEDAPELVRWAMGRANRSESDRLVFAESHSWANRAQQLGQVLGP